MTNEPQEPALSFVAALKAFSSIPHSPRKAFRTIAAHRTLNQALILILSSALLSAIAHFFAGGHVLNFVTIFYVVEVPYSDLAWAMNEFVERLARVAGMVLIAFLIAATVSKSREPLGKYVSTIGFFIPWSLLVSRILSIAWSTLSDAFPESGFILIYFAIYLPAFIWLLWLLGNAISTAGSVPISDGVLAGLAILFLWPISASIFGWPISLILLVVCFAWRTYWKRTV
jgi:hypothetical protein